MEDKESVYAQFAEHFSTLEEMEAYKRKEAEEQSEASQEWVEVSKGVFVSPKQAQETGLDIIPQQFFGTESEAEKKHKHTAISPAIKPESSIERNKYFSTIRQGTSTNALTKLRAIEGKNTTIDSVTGEATIKSENLILKIPNYSKLTDLRTSTYQLLDAITIVLTETGAKSPTVVLSLQDYMERRGLKDRKEARKQIAADLDVLLKSSLSWVEKRKGGSIPFAGVNISDSWIWADAKKTAIVYTFGTTFFNVLSGYPVMPYPAQLQTIDTRRNPNSFHILRRISEHKNMNIGKANEDIIAVKTLLAVAPFIPSIDEVMAGNRNISDRIISPFERDMDVLEPTLSWHYCHSNGEPLTDAELQGFSYDFFTSLMIKTEWKNYPDQTARLERKAERLEQTKKKKRTTSKKKKPAEG